MRKSNKFDAAFLSDLHFRDAVPSCRAETKDEWRSTQIDYIRQVRKLLADHGGPPLFVAGDVFHKAMTEPHTVNMVLDNMPTFWAVPGNHDLPNHNPDHIERSSFGTLVASQLITHVTEPIMVGPDENMVVHPFGCGHEPHPLPKECRTDGVLHIALIHSYVWKDGHAFPGVSEETHAHEWNRRMKGFDFLVFGDNHQGFTHTSHSRTVINCGAFIRSRQDELNHRPAITFISARGDFKQVPLDISRDRFIMTPEKPKTESTMVDTEKLVGMLSGSLQSVEGFTSAVRGILDNKEIRAGVRTFLKELLEETG